MIITARQACRQVQRNLPTSPTSLKGSILCGGVVGVGAGTIGITATGAGTAIGAAAAVAVPVVAAATAIVGGVKNLQDCF